jgi:hypothetical protein
VTLPLVRCFSFSYTHTTGTKAKDVHASDFMLQQEPDRNAAGPFVMLLETNDLSEKTPVSGGQLAIGKSYDNSHSGIVVRHARQEKQPVASEINHFAHVLDLDKSCIKRSHMHWQ